MVDKPPSDAPWQFITVTGPLTPDRAGITDAHNHLWIAAMPGAYKHAPVLDNAAAIRRELIDYRQAGGQTIIDCQPGGCGRDGRKLAELAGASGVYIVAATGYHLRKYYPPDYWLFTTSADEAKELFVRELTESLEETVQGAQQVRAGFIKIACEETVERSPTQLMEAAAQASLETGAAIEVHTEKGADADRIVAFLLDSGLIPNRIVLCHMDKRPDLDLHLTLAEEGVMLEYDTFYRPKYQPEENVWLLLEQMIGAGLSRQIAIATDMAEALMWTRMGEGPGLTSLVTRIIPRLEKLGISKEIVQGLVGHNITDCLACPCRLPT